MESRVRCFLLLPSVVLLAACAAGTPPPADAGSDAGGRDAGRDAGRDSGTPPMDASPTDDAATPEDGGADAAAACPAGQSLCEDECVDTSSDVTRCGGCDVDCTTLANVVESRVTCRSMACSVFGACRAGYGDCNSTVGDGCEASLTTSTHCGNCTVSCSDAAPLCSASSAGPYRCVAACDGRTPDRCGDDCVDVQRDALHCGGCDRPCPTGGPHTRATCTAGVCGIACDIGYHDCGGTCVSDSDPATCGTSCTPCPTPMAGVATCIGGTCGVMCDAGATLCSGDCADITTSNAHCGGCDRPCSGACVAGVCDTGVRLVLESGMDQTAYPDQQLAMAIVVRAHDAAMNPIVGATVTFTAPPGAAVSPASVPTDSMGRAITVARLGRALGGYAFSASVPMALGPVTVNATAVAPPAGTLFPIANVARASSSAGTPGPATVAGMGAVRGVAIASDGTVYVADTTYRVVRAISPAGEMTIVAGQTSLSGTTGDGGPATMARLTTPSGLALDETAGLLYIADQGAHRVRAVSLSTGVISTLAGGGTAAGPGYGDGGSATGAALASPGHVRVGPDRAIYIADVGHNRIRRVDATTGIIDAWMNGGSTTCAGARLSLYGCQSEPRTCDIAWDAAGRAFVSGYFCGSDMGTTTYGVVRRATDGTLTHVAGRAAGLTADGSPATQALLNGAGSLAFDPAGNLYYVENTSHRVRRIDGATSTITTVVGTGSTGDGSDYTAATGQGLNVPWDVAFDSARHLYVSESTNRVVRTIWELADTAAATPRLDVVSGTPQSALVDAQVTDALTVRLSSGGSAIVGVPIAFAPIDEGGGLAAASGTTTALGTVGMFGRPGLLPGLYRFEARFDDLHGVPVMGSPATFEVTATAPAAGAIFTAVNVARMAGAVPGPATYGRIGQPTGLAAANDGTIYIADRTQHVVWRLSPRGQLGVFAGTPGSAGFVGDGDLATSARLNAPTGLALDATNGILYIADRANNRVRSVDLATNVIRTVAGGGPVLAAPFGDDGPATSAYLVGPGNVAVGPDGRIYVSDTGHNRIRVVDPVTGIISAWLGPSGACSSAPLVFNDCATSSYTTCNVLFEADGTAYVSGRICGNTAPLTTSVVYGIVRRDPDGTLTHIAGRPTGMTTDGVLATQALIGGAGWLARDASGALHYTDFGSHRLRRIDPTSGTVSTIAGTGAAGFSGEYVTSIAAQLSLPWGIVFSGGHLFLADTSNLAVRVIW